MYISALPVPFWPCLYQKNSTSLLDLQDCLIWTWKYISKLPGEKGYAYHPERILDNILLLFTVSPSWPQILSTIHGFSALAASNKPQIIRSKKLISIDGCIHRKNKFIIHSYENPIYDDQTCTPRPRYVAGPKKNRLTKHLDLTSPWLLPLLLLLLLAMECVRPCRSTCCHLDETPSFSVLLQTAHDYPTPVFCHC